MKNKSRKSINWVKRLMLLTGRGLPEDTNLTTGLGILVEGGLVQGGLVRTVKIEALAG